jgi:ribosome biogenesis GTPase / thiamine phosphate phosphatase
MIKGRVIKTTGNIHTVETDSGVYSCSLKGNFRIKGIRSTNPVAVGDYVEFDIEQDNLGIIKKIYERKNCIVRKSSNLSKDNHIIASNIDQALILFTIKKPVTTTVFLDRLLVGAESYSIKPIIIFNKIDLYLNEELKDLNRLRDIYEKIGYKVIDLSLKTGFNLEKIKQILKEKTNVIIGHSGVGKSSLVNNIEPGYNLKVGKISDFHQSGIHITTYAQMIQLSNGGNIIDTPGIRGFGIFDIKSEEISHFFPEFFEKSKLCKYYNCTHIHEPDCAVINAIENGEISYSRYRSYLNMMLDENDKHRQKDVNIY